MGNDDINAWLRNRGRPPQSPAIEEQEITPPVADLGQGNRGPSVLPPKTNSDVFREFLENGLYG